MISKTSFLAGFQCPKLLWKRINDRDALPPVDEGKQAIFDQGHAIGELAKELYPGGIEVGEGVDHRKNVVEETATLLDRRVPLYEPAFAFEDGYARIDILVPDGPDAWRIVEVKSGTKVKDENLLDVAFQLHVCRGAGLKITHCALVHVNNAYVRQGKIDPSGLLIEEDVTEAVTGLLPDIAGRLSELSAVVELPICPEVSIGAHCSKPYSCELKSDCWSFLPKYPITDLYNDKKGQRWEFLEAGIHGLADVPESRRLNLKQQLQIKAARSGEPHIAELALAHWFKTLRWPLAFFDIETASSAIPFYDGTRPYQQVPFQFSLHVQHEPRGEVVHHEFLASGSEDPRPAFLEKLKGSFPKKGYIIVYNASFERSCMLNCARDFPEHAWVEDILDRMHDLLVPFRQFWYHHPDQHGSASIKHVYPSVVGSSYSHLAIQDGQTAARAYAQAEFGDATPEERERIRRDLLAYCELDTRAMVELLDAIRGLAGMV
jgi:hypothetical protein